MKDDIGKIIKLPQDLHSVKGVEKSYIWLIDMEGGNKNEHSRSNKV